MRMIPALALLIFVTGLDPFATVRDAEAAVQEFGLTVAQQLPAQAYGGLGVVQQSRAWCMPRQPVEQGMLSPLDGDLHGPKRVVEIQRQAAIGWLSHFAIVAARGGANSRESRIGEGLHLG